MLHLSTDKTDSAYSYAVRRAMGPIIGGPQGSRFQPRVEQEAKPHAKSWEMETQIEKGSATGATLKKQEF